MWLFRTWFSRHGGVGITVGLDDLRGLFQPSWFYDSAPWPVWTGRFTWPSARQNSHDGSGQQADALLCRQAPSSAGRRLALHRGKRGRVGGSSLCSPHVTSAVRMPCLRRQVLKKVSHMNDTARKPCFHVQLPTSRPAALEEFLKHSMTYLCSCKWSWSSLWETGWLSASLAHCLPLQPSVDWQLSILLVTCIKGRSLEGFCVGPVFQYALFSWTSLCYISCFGLREDSFAHLRACNNSQGVTQIRNNWDII